MSEKTFPSSILFRHWLIAAGILCKGSVAQGEIFGFDYRGTVSWWNSYQHNPALEDSAVNPSNLVLRLPQDRYISEVRPNLKFVSSNVQLILRPRFRYSLKFIKAGDDPDPYERSKVNSFVSEAFGQWTASDSLTFALGVQSYQWGAAEILSPSNRIFHETAQDRTNLFEARGRYLARINYSFGKTFSTVIMGEYLENRLNTDIRTYSADETWYPTILIKPEFNWNNGENYIGLVLGHREQGQPWLGEYFSYAVPWIEGFTVYADASHEHGSTAWYPEEVTPAPGRPAIVQFRRSRKDETRIYNLVTSGARYDFEDGSIMRLEYVYNDAAYSKDERRLALASFESIVPEQLALKQDNTRRFLAPGLELQGQRLVYASLYIPNPWSIKDLVFFARALGSTSDASKTYYLSGDYNIGDSGTFSYAYSHSLGARDGEVKGFSAPLHIVAYRLDW